MRKAGPARKKTASLSSVSAALRPGRGRHAGLRLSKGLSKRTKDRAERKVKRMLSGGPGARGSLSLAGVLGVLLLLNVYVFVCRNETSLPDVMHKAEVLAANPLSASVQATQAIADAHASKMAKMRVVTGTLEDGDSLGRVLKRHAVEQRQADAVIRSLSAQLDFTQLRRGQPYTLTVRPDGQVYSFELTVSKELTVRSWRFADGSMRGEAEKAQTHVEIVEVAAPIESSLYASILAVGENEALVAFFVDVFAYDVDFYNDTYAGDVFRVIVEKEMKGEEFLRYRRILAAEYSGKAGTFRAFYWQEPNASKGRYFSEKGESIEKSFLKTPLKFSRISSGFNRNRMHPVLHVARGHFGTDYAAPVGTPVWAAASGKIVSRGYSGGAGNMVVLEHAGGLVTQYMHLSKFASGQRIGQRVEAKTVIGYVGTTGLSSGPHLHFGVKKNGAYVDPQKLAPTREPGVKAIDTAKFKEDTAVLVSRLAGIPLGRKSAEAGTLAKVRIDLPGMSEPLAVEVPTTRVQ